LGILLLASHTSASWAAQDAAGRNVSVGFHRDVLPIFKTRCAGCHSIDDYWWHEVRDGGGQNYLAKGLPVRGLNLTSYDGLMKTRVIVPGQPNRSLLFRKVELPTRLDSDEGEPMPWLSPKLKARQIDILRQWILEGATRDEDTSTATLVSLPGVSLAESRARDEQVSVLCRVAQPSYATVIVRDTVTGRVLSARGGAVSEDHQSAPGGGLDRASAARPDGWLAWSIEPLETFWPRDGSTRRTALPDVVSIDLLIQYNEKGLYGTEFGIHRRTQEDAVAARRLGAPLARSFARPNPVDPSTDKSIEFHYRLDADADVLVEIAALGSESGMVHQDRQVDLAQGVKVYAWDLHDKNGARIPPGDYVARFRCTSRNPARQVNDVCVVFAVR
jgi:hypothetical protein